eukprot:scaffold34603_cov212-Amphora_coffeaeformis.AAC.1
MNIGVGASMTEAIERSTDDNERGTSTDAVVLVDNKHRREEAENDAILLSTEEGEFDDAILDIKCCRICLDGEDEPGMIAPCRCKGTSKWVHRACLDQWRAYNAEDLAFSQCMECRFPFQFEESSSSNDKNKTHRTRCLYWFLVSRDLLVATVVVQAIILVFAFIFWSVAQNEEGVIEWADNGTDDSLNPICQSSTCQFWSCYAMGILVLFFCLGIYGSIRLCRNDCSVYAAIHAGEQPHHHRGGGGGNSTSPTNNCCSGTECGNCDCGGCDGEGAAAVILVLSIIIGAVLIIIGFVLAAIVSVVVVQTIVRRHVWILQKKTLAKEYRVRDLSGHPEALSLDTPMRQTMGGGIEMDRLIKLGLMEKN